MLRGWSFLVSFGLVAGCATGETLDDEGSGGGSSGGSAGAAAVGGKTDNPTGGGAGQGAGGGSAGASGGAAGSGSGGQPSGGAPGSGGAATGGSGGCSGGEKSCGGLCVPPSPGVGCSTTTCTPCGAISNANLKCTGDQCDFDCVSGYVKSGSSCVPQSGSGGSPGTGGSTGTGGSSGCAMPCNFSDAASQFVCTAACLLTGQNVGLCLPTNCCFCSS
ncbi:MAG: hypothetical protein KF718_20790 [Polyangiaceae bacterium]|nr:hypothetical protein [Polyangiaceae bacterium]